MADNRIVFYPVGNGSMTLLQVEGRSILFDINILGASEDNGDYAVIEDLEEALKKCEKKDGHPVVDVFIQSHADNDHINGFGEYFFEEADPENLTAKDKAGERKKIFIKEIWCSDRFRKYDTDDYSMGEDAKAFRREVKRRIDKFKAGDTSDGNLVKILGDCLDADDNDIIPDALRKGIGETIEVGRTNNLVAEILGPIKQQTGDEKEEYNESDEDYIGSKNRSSLIIRFALKLTNYLGESRTIHILMGDDTECFVWKVLDHKGLKSELEYDLLLAPHHASWHALSNDSATEDDDPEVDAGAKRALSHKKKWASVVVSAKARDKETDDSKIAGRRLSLAEYESIVGKDNIFNPNEIPNSDTPQPLEFSLTMRGIHKQPSRSAVPASIAATSTVGQTYPHG